MRSHTAVMACLACALATLAAIGAKAGERVALVVGNANYAHAPRLANPGNDAEDMAAVLRRLRFTVTVGTDLGDAEMEAHVRAFSRQAGAAEVAVFFYAGHGLQVDGVNYLVPTDARLAAASDLPFEAVALDLVLKGMGGGTNLAFLDACRDNPFARAWVGGRSASVGRGLSRVSKVGTGGLFIAFATDPDSTADDGEGRNSPFTAALKEYIETAGLEVNGLLTQVRRTVLASTGDAQRPWSNSSLSDEFYFVPPSPSPTGAKPDTPSLPADAPDPATEMWLQIRGTTSVQLLERYLATYPNSPYRPSAEARLNEVRGQPFTVVVEPSGAKVRVLGMSAPYRAGMRLPAGSYRVEASAEDHETATETVAHGSTPTLHRMALRKMAVGPKVGERFRDCAVCPEMVVVPAGSFLMGSLESEEGRDDDEGPVHQVRIDASFAMGVYEVTFAEWDACEEDGGCRGYSPDDEGWGRERRPVIHVNWKDAQAYVGWLSAKTGERYRLPSEAEWEYAAQGGTRTSRPWGKGESRQCRHANGADAAYKRQHTARTVASCDDGHVYTAPVGRYEQNARGLHDVLGNVWEWTGDCWNASYEGAPTDGSAWDSGDCSRRVLRGGSWVNRPSVLRAANRYWNSTGSRFVNNGFRVARTLTP